MLKILRTAILYAGIYLSISSSMADALPLRESTTRLQAFLSAMEPFGFSGTVLVGVGDSIVFQEAYGMADDGASITVTPETAFDIGSLAKQFTATAILLLESQGKLSLSDSICEYLPNVPSDKRMITIRQLLTHTSGLGRSNGLVPEASTTSQFVESVLATRLRFEPGQRFGYSNAGYLLLAAIVESTSKTEYEAFVHDQLLSRVGLTSTGFYRDKLWSSTQVAHGYVEYIDQGSPLLWTMRTNLGSGGMISTAADLLKWMRALHSQKVLPTAKTDELFSGLVDSDEENTKYGFGWYHSTTGRHTKIVWHEGDFNGFNSLCRWYVDEDVTMIYLCNRALRYGVGYKVAMRNNLERAWWGDSVRMPPIVVPVSEPKQYSGEYVIDLDTKFVVTEYAGRLLIYPSGQAAVNIMCAAHLPDSVHNMLISLDRVSSNIVNFAAMQDSTALISTMGAEPYNFAGRFLRNTIRALSDSLGQLKKIVNVGTFPYPFEDDLQQSFFHLVYARDTAQILLGWHEGAINDVTSFDNARDGLLSLPRPGLQALAMFKNGTLVTYDPFTRQVMTLQPSSEGGRKWIATSGDRQIKILRK